MATLSCEGFVSRIRGVTDGQAAPARSGAGAERSAARPRNRAMTAPSATRTSPARAMDPTAAPGATSTSTNDTPGHQSRARNGAGTVQSRVSVGMVGQYPFGCRPNPGRYRRGVDHAAALLEHNALLVEATTAVDPELAVPTCPGWTVRNLLTHVGRGDRWAAEIVRTGRPVELRSVPDGKPPAEPGEWLAASPRLLLDAVAVDPAKPVWTFLGPRPAAWWIRRRLHESTVHWADAVLAAGSHPELAPAVAVDGLSEWLDLVTSREAGSPLDPGTTLHLHATDGSGGEWMITEEGWAPGHGKGTAAVRGSASDLLLATLRRIPADRVEVLGDPDVYTRWLERTSF